MEILNYKNKFKAIYDILFNITGFQSRLQAQETRNIEAAVKRVTMDFEDKILFLLNEETQGTAILPSEPNFHKIHIAEMQIPSVRLQRENYPLSSGREQEHAYQSNKLFFGVCDTDSPLERIKQAASKRIASELIEKDS